MNFEKLITNIKRFCVLSALSTDRDFGKIKISKTLVFVGYHIYQMLCESSLLAG